MHLKHKSVILISILVVSFSCTIKSIQPVEPFICADLTLLDSIQTPKIPYKSLCVPKTTFRLDHNGQFRNLKSTLYAVPDSLIAVSINSPLGKEVVKCIMVKDNIQFFDFQVNKAYSFDYKYLSSALGIEIDFYKVQNIILGYHSPNTFQFDYNTEVCELLHSNSFIKGDLTINRSVNDNTQPYKVIFTYTKSIEKLNKYTIFVNQNDYIFSLVYDWTLNSPSDIPRSVQIEFNYLKNSIGIDIDFKTFEKDVKKTYLYKDSTIKFTPLVLENEIY